MGGRPVLARALLYEMATGRASPGRESAVGLRSSGKDAEQARSLETGTPKGWSGSFGGLLEREPERRFQSAAEWSGRPGRLEPERRSARRAGLGGGVRRRWWRGIPRRDRSIRRARWRQRGSWRPGRMRGGLPHSTARGGAAHPELRRWSRVRSWQRTDCDAKAAVLSRSRLWLSRCPRRRQGWCCGQRPERYLRWQGPQPMREGGSRGEETDGGRGAGWSLCAPARHYGFKEWPELGSGSSMI